MEPRKFIAVFTPLLVPIPNQINPIHTIQSSLKIRFNIINFSSLRSFIQGIYPGPMLLVIFRNNLIFYGELLLATRPTTKLGDHPLSALHDCLLIIFAATLHTWKATWWRTMPWWPNMS
jgi:hypothetical protein